MQMYQLYWLYMYIALNLKIGAILDLFSKKWLIKTNTEIFNSYFFISYLIE